MEEIEKYNMERELGGLEIEDNIEARL